MSRLNSISCEDDFCQQPISVNHSVLRSHSQTTTKKNTSYLRDRCERPLRTLWLFLTTPFLLKSLRPLRKPLRLCGLIIFILLTVTACEEPAKSPVQISGIYPHLAVFNQPDNPEERAGHQESGIGAVVPWADKLWYITYPPHQTRGSNDKLHEIDADLNLTIRPESVGGTHANRMIHRESQQLIIGPYFIDTLGHVRAADVNQLKGRMTATMRHLTDPANWVYFFDMEGAIYEVNVHTLEVKRLFEKPVPGWHGKGGYTAQGRIVIANNGERDWEETAYPDLQAGGPPEGDEAGVLAEWDGQEWRIVERKQFTDVMGPGGIYGNQDDSQQLWSMGWDKSSVILKLLDEGKWYTYRLPKGSHTFDPRHGWYTEWPRIRKISPTDWMMVMHGSMFAFPGDFRAFQSGGIRPIATHLRYIPDFCYWNGQLILAADDASAMQNPLVGQPQSNLWFGQRNELDYFGPKAGWGGVWMNEQVEADQPSDPFLIAGYEQRILHLAHDADEQVRFTIEVDESGLGEWTVWQSFSIPAKGYFPLQLPGDLKVEWLSVRADKACVASAYMHLYSPRSIEENESDIFAGLLNVGERTAAYIGVIRPAAHSRSLQWIEQELSADGKLSKENYREIRLSKRHTELQFSNPSNKRLEETKRVADLPQKPVFEVDEASVIIKTESGKRYRLPKGNPAFDEVYHRMRDVREAVSERYLANIHGTFYEIPRTEGAGAHTPDFAKIKPISSHDKHITDFCTWRGLLVLSGVRKDAPQDGHVFSDKNGKGLWFGMIDDLWKLGKPTGRGGPWKNTMVKANEASDPYLMTGYEHKKLTITHDQAEEVAFLIEVQFAHDGQWHVYQGFEVPAGEGMSIDFPDGFQAHWVRLRAEGDCVASAIFEYNRVANEL